MEVSKKIRHGDIGEEEVINDIREYLGLTDLNEFTHLGEEHKSEAGQRLNNILMKVADGALIPLMNTTLKKNDVEKLASLKGIPIDDSSQGNMSRCKVEGVKKEEDIDDLMAVVDADIRLRETESENPTVDLIVLGINYSTTEHGMHKYFETFGDVVFCELMVGVAGKSKGFGFIRFANMAAQLQVLLTRHFIDMCWCDVRIADSSSKDKTNTIADSKVFVTRVTDALTDDDLRQHFEQFGEITDSYCPRPSRGYAFIQFIDARVAKALLEKDHMIKGVSVHTKAAKPKVPAASRNDFGGGRASSIRGEEAGYYWEYDRENQGSWQRHACDGQYDPFRDMWA